MIDSRALGVDCIIASFAGVPPVQPRSGLFFLEVDSQRTRRGLAENSQRTHRGLTEDSQKIHRGLTEDPQPAHGGLAEDS